MEGTNNIYLEMTDAFTAPNPEHSIYESDANMDDSIIDEILQENNLCVVNNSLTDSEGENVLNIVTPSSINSIPPLPFDDEGETNIESRKRNYLKNLNTLYNNSVCIKINDSTFIRAFGKFTKEDIMRISQVKENKEMGPKNKQDFEKFILELGVGAILYTRGENNYFFITSMETK